MERPEVVAFAPEGVSSAPDVGCSTVGVVRALKVRGVQTVWGIEPDPQAGAAQPSVTVARIDE